MDVPALVCSLCNGRSSSLTLWMSHLRQVHVSDVDISVSCPVRECGTVYSKVNSLCSHIYRRHKDLLLVLDSTKANVTSCDKTIASEIETSTSIITLDHSVPDSFDHDVNVLLHKDGTEQKKKSVLFLMQLKEERLLTQAAVDDVVSGCKEVLGYTLSHIKAGVSRSLSKSGINFEDIDGLDDVFSDVSDPFVGLESAYLQDKFISQELGCIVSSQHDVYYL